MSKDVTAGLIRALVANMKGARDDWASLAMVIDLSGARINGTHGYAYSPDGTIWAVASRPSSIKPEVEAFLESSYNPEQKPPKKILVQFARETEKYEVTFEDHDPTRWKVTPANIEQMSQELRPNLD